MSAELTHEIEVNQVYEDARTDERVQLLYVDSNIYVLQNEIDASHRLGSYKELMKNIESGRYQYLPEAEPFAVTDVDGDNEEIPFEELDSIGKTGAQNLRESGYETVADVRMASDDELTDVSWVGEAGVYSIRQWCEN